MNYKLRKIDVFYIIVNGISSFLLCSIFPLTIIAVLFDIFNLSVYEENNIILNSFFAYTYLKFFIGFVIALKIFTILIKFTFKINIEKIESILR